MQDIGCMKNLFFALKYAATKKVSKFFTLLTAGNTCIVCKKEVFGMPLCASCRKSLFVHSSPNAEMRCQVCGKILVSEQGVCMRCRREKILSHTDTVFPLFSYRLWNKRLLLAWKDRGERLLSPFFASCLSRALESFEKDIAIVPIPPRKGKLRKKGWDQVEELSEFLEKLYGYKICRCLFRETEVQQKTLDRVARLSTLGKSYCMKKGRALAKSLKKFSGVLPKHVCVIDDVSTTGATLESAAQALKEAGVERVDAVTLFMVD